VPPRAGKNDQMSAFESPCSFLDNRNSGNDSYGCLVIARTVITGVLFFPLISSGPYCQKIR